MGPVADSFPEAAPFLATTLASLVFFRAVLRQIRKRVAPDRQGLVSSRVATAFRLALGLGAALCLLSGAPAASAHLYIVAASISLLDYPEVRITFWRGRSPFAGRTRILLPPSTGKVLHSLMLSALALRAIYRDGGGAPRAGASENSPAALGLDSPEPVASPIAALAYLLVDSAISAIPQVVAERSSSTLYQPVARSLVLLAILISYWPVLIPWGNAEAVPAGLEVYTALPAGRGLGGAWRYLLADVTGRGWVVTLASATLAAALCIEGLGGVFVGIPPHWYANCISICNFLCGFSGLLLCALGRREAYGLAVRVVCLILLGQFLDLFDGRAADRWGSTPHGELLDDLADGTSFGLCMGLLVYRCMRGALEAAAGVAGAAAGPTAGEAPLFPPIAPRPGAPLWPSLLSAALAVSYAGCIIFRLVRFIANKRALNTKGGVCFFVGLPSPGTAACTGMLCILLARATALHAAGGLGAGTLAACAAATMLVIAGLSWLTVSSVPYAHFGRVFNHPGRSSPALRAATHSAVVVSLLYALLFRSARLFLIEFGTGTIFYLLTPLYARRAGLYEKVLEEHDAVVEMTATLRSEKRARRQERHEARRERRGARAKARAGAVKRPAAGTAADTAAEPRSETTCTEESDPGSE